MSQLTRMLSKPVHIEFGGPDTPAAERPTFRFLSRISAMASALSSTKGVSMGDALEGRPGLGAAGLGADMDASGLPAALDIKVTGDPIEVGIAQARELAGDDGLLDAGMLGLVEKMLSKKGGAVPESDKGYYDALRSLGEQPKHYDLQIPETLALNREHRDGIDPASAMALALERESAAALVVTGGMERASAVAASAAGGKPVSVGYMMYVQESLVDATAALSLRLDDRFAEGGVAERAIERLAMVRSSRILSSPESFSTPALLEVLETDMAPIRESVKDMGAEERQRHLAGIAGAIVSGCALSPMDFVRTDNIAEAVRQFPAKELASNPDAKLGDLLKRRLPEAVIEADRRAASLVLADDRKPLASILAATRMASFARENAQRKLSAASRHAPDNSPV